MSAPTKTEALAAAAACFAEGRRQRDSLPVPEAARRAFTPGGPPLVELERRIRALRTQAVASSTA